MSPGYRDLTTTNARNHSMPKTPVTLEALAIFPVSRHVRCFAYKEEVDGSSPSTVTTEALLVLGLLRSLLPQTPRYFRR